MPPRSPPFDWPLALSSWRLIVRLQSRPSAPAKPPARTRLRTSAAIGPLALFGYAAPFSFAYLRIGAAVGALILFGSSS